MIKDILTTRSRPSLRLDQLVRRLSHPQLYNLHLASHYRLKRSSMGWWPEDHPRRGVTEPVQISAPAPIRSLWRMGLLDGTPDAQLLGHAGLVTLTPELWTNDKGRMLLDYIRRDVGIFFDPSSDCLIYPKNNEVSCGSLAVH
jgi:hypothetical protein